MIRQSKVDVGSIGPRPCEVALNRFLAEEKDNHMTRMVTRTLHAFRAWIKQLQHIPDPGYRKLAIANYLDEFIERVVERKFPPHIESHTRCCLVTYYREAVGMVKKPK